MFSLNHLYLFNQNASITNRRRCFRANDLWLQCLPLNKEAFSFISQFPLHENPSGCWFRASLWPATIACKWDLHCNESDATTELWSFIDLSSYSFTSMSNHFYWEFYLKPPATSLELKQHAHRWSFCQPVDQNACLANVDLIHFEL